MLDKELKTASFTAALTPNGFSLEASFVIFLSPNSRASSSIGFPPWYGLNPRIDSQAFIKLLQDKSLKYLI